MKISFIIGSTRLKGRYPISLFWSFFVATLPQDDSCKVKKQPFSKSTKQMEESISLRLDCEFMKATEYQ